MSKQVNYWAVGASFGGDNDVSEDFIKNEEWYDGYANNNGDERNKTYLEKVNVNDILLIKSSATKGTNHKTSFTRLKKVGIVTEKVNYFHFKVKWLNVPDLPKDFDNIYYGKTIEPLREDEIYNFIKNLFGKENLNDIIKLLKYKYQIILQGPPGTGKTYNAKLIAKELTKSNKKTSPIKYIEKYIENYKDDREAKRVKANLEALLKEFHEDFPANELSNLTLESYCIGSGKQDSFCYWMEQKLNDLGKFSPGPGGAPVYVVYFSKDENKYLTSKGKNPNEVMKVLAETIYELINNSKIENAQKYFRNSYILKILNSYFPEKYFPVYNREHIKNIANIFEIVVNDLDDIEINIKINQKFQELKTKYSSQISNTEIMGILYGKFYNKIKFGNDDDEEFETVENLSNYKLIQFHPSYSYEDFVRGISATTNVNNTIEYRVENRILTKFAIQALNDSENNYVLIIDEINRANLSSVLGELIYALEYRYDRENPRDTTVESIYAFKEFKEDMEGIKEIKLPKNLFIIGTMNTADRSVGHIDYAIRRRFAFVNILPKSIPELTENGKKLFLKVAELFCKEFKENEIELENSDYLASDFKATDVMIGHSYFLIKQEERDELKISDDEILKLKLKYEVKPILREYLKDGIFNDNAKDKIDKL